MEQLESDDDNILCICNPKNTVLDTHLLHFSYIYVYCIACQHLIPSTHDDEDYEYEYLYEFNKYEYIQIKNLLTQNPDIIYEKNYMNAYPLDLINHLQEILEDHSNYSYNTKSFRHIHSNIKYLGKIKKLIEFEYIKHELVKHVAFRYIKNSNYIGITNNDKQRQLPLEIWEYIFTYI